MVYQLHGVYARTSEWTSDYLQKSPDRNPSVIAFPTEAPNITEPKGFSAKVNERFREHALHNPLANQFVAAIPGGQVYGASGTVVSPDDFILWDLSPDLGHSVHEHSVLAHDTFPPITRTRETLGVLTSPIGFHYYHWLFEVLARLDLLNRSGVKIDRYVVNLSDYSPFQRETLRIAGIPDDRLIDCTEETHLQADLLVVPSFAAYTGHVPKWACDFLRDKLLPFAENRAHAKRIFVSRSDAAWRKVINEPEIMRFLEAFGFEVVVPGTLSWREQMNIFSSAEIVVGPHGAGLTNLLYCSPKAKVIELLLPCFLSPNFWVISNHIGLDYYYVLAESVRGLTDGWEANDDMLVHIAELEKILRLAGVI